MVEQIHQTRADITRKASHNSHALTLAAQEIAQAAGKKFGVKWRRSPVNQRQIETEVGVIPGIASLCQPSSHEYVLSTALSSGRERLMSHQKLCIWIQCLYQA
jgi:hypothetical protein